MANIKEDPITPNMPIEFEIKLLKVSGSLRMTVPKPITRSLGLKAGDVVLVGLSDSTMTVRKRV